ncbi:hypothetical protein BOX15_Mlig027757g4 [Macrostomum lignano]|uniref:long-chain-fatty-acid--CoA ligase n=2 Tax=Macrostomum lignano TaxID=282301 RepID=A0A1I8FVE8_9PLAT|nr:hypothetical protein BOX15_Mlig027757g4 [Macrostomum lignano]
MAHAKVAPQSLTDDEAEILRSTRPEDQDRRHEIFSSRLAGSPHQNVLDLFLTGERVSCTQPCLGRRDGERSPYTWLSYREVLQQARCVSHFLTGQLHLRRGAFVAIWSKNRTEWVTLELGCFMTGLVPVPLYDTLGDEACDYVLKQTGAAVMLCEGRAQAAGLTRLKSGAQIQHLIQLDFAEVANSEVAEGPKVWSWSDVLSTGRELEERLAQAGKQQEQPVGRADLAVLCYTSGTTGPPKGVQITHGNLVAEVLGMHEFLVAHGGQHAPVPHHDDVYLSYLPLAHIFERIMQLFCFMQGMRIGFFRGDIAGLTADMRELQPTVFCTVPRLLNRIYDLAHANVAGSCLKSLIFNLALRKKTEEVDRGVIRNNSMWDSLVFSKVREPTGGRIRLVIVGSAPLAESVMRFARAAFGCPVMEGYGQSEATGGSTCTPPTCVSTGHVGVPLFQNAVMLQDVPEMDYFSRDGRGEVCVRGPNVTSGYFAQPDKTAEAIDSAGWLHTGDIGEWLPGGLLRIIDRKKHLFKLAQGEYLAPEKIEQVYATCPTIQQVYVDGDSLESCALAVVVPSAEAAQAWAHRHREDSAGSPEVAMTAACGSEEFKQAVMQEMLAAGKAAGLKSFEQAKDIVLHPEAFSIENGLLTPTFKARRPELRKRFGDEFKRMYQKMKTGG